MKIPEAIRDELRRGSALTAPGDRRPDFLGAGRSAVVFRDRDAAGRATARKVFESSGLTKFVQYVFLGAPNPYAWCEDAALCALLRRRILAPLVRYWFGERLDVADGLAIDWNDEARAYQLHTRFVDGRPPSLNHPLRRDSGDEVRELRTELLSALLDRLEDTGFFGAAWQAGRGNPVALANFLLVESDRSGPHWCWIDLESGVPALFPADPRELLCYYLPMAWRFRRVMFDDVDCTTLCGYLERNREALTTHLGAEGFGQLENDAKQLERHQDLWKSLSRADRAISYRHSKGHISTAEADWYRQHPLRWYARESVRLPVAVAGSVARRLGRAARWLARFDYGSLGLGILRFLTSQKYRRSLAQRFVARRIGSWRRRGRLSEDQAETLLGCLVRRETCAYLTDFGVHIAIKPFVKSVEWLVFPAMYAAGWISETTLLVAVLSGGCVARTLYTAGRFVQATLKGRERPWVALGVGALPVVGNLAYPMQIVYTGRNELLAQFILYDGFTTIGRKLPIWGGPDTLTEHAFNRLTDRIVARAAPE